MSRDAGKPVFGFPTISNLTRSDQSQKFRSLIFKIQVDGVMYHPCSENQGADQLCSYCEAELHFFLFSHRPKSDFPIHRFLYYQMYVKLISDKEEIRSLCIKYT